MAYEKDEELKFDLGLGSLIEELRTQNENKKTTSGATSTYDSSKYSDVPISSVPTGTGADNGDDYKKQQEEVLGMYDNNAQQTDLNVHSARQRKVMDDYVDNPDEWFRMYKYWNWNLGKNDPDGNLNNKSFNDTLRYSRVADALNNRRFYIPAQIGRRTNSGFGTNEYKEGRSERWEPIETQETRQMRTNEEMTELARRSQIARAQRVQDYALKLRETYDQAMSEANKYIFTTGIDTQRLMQAGKWSSEYQGSWQTYWNNFMTKYGKELDVNIRDRVMTKISRLGYPFRQIYGYLNGINVPNPIVESAWQAIENAMKEEKDPTQKTYIGLAIASILAGGAFGNVRNMFGAGTGGILSYDKLNQ